MNHIIFRMEFVINRLLLLYPLLVDCCVDLAGALVAMMAAAVLMDKVLISIDHNMIIQLMEF